MENQYKKTFPDLMVGKKIICVHGFMSAGSRHTVQILRDYMPEATVIAPDLPIHPEEAMELLRNLVNTEKPGLIIGTSMGGMYTEMLYGVDRICVNPAFQMGTTISESNMMGKQVFQNPRQDGVQEVIVTKALVKEYKELYIKLPFLYIFLIIVSRSDALVTLHLPLPVILIFLPKSLFFSKIVT